MSKDIELNCPKTITCGVCMVGAPYEWCCALECNEHEFCRGCTYNNRGGYSDESK